MKIADNLIKSDEEMDWEDVEFTEELDRDDDHVTENSEELDGEQHHITYNEEMVREEN